MKILMHVYVKYREDKSPWKTWCISSSAPTVVRFGAYGSTLRERSLGLSDPDVAKRMDDKLKEGYVYQGEYWVDEEVREKATASKTQMPQTQPINSEDLVLWRGSGTPPDNWMDETVKMLSPLVSVVAKENAKDQLLLAPSIEFRFKIDALGNSRGRIGKSKFDAISLVVLMAIAKTSQILSVVDRDGNKISTTKFREGMPHLAFESTSFQDFDNMMRTVGLIQTRSGAMMSGATAFI